MATPTRCVNPKCNIVFGSRGLPSKHKSRGLCKLCYEYHTRIGELSKFERLTYSLDERASDIRLLASHGLTRTEIAEKLGVTRDCIDKAYTRGIRHGLLLG